MNENTGSRDSGRDKYDSEMRHIKTTTRILERGWFRPEEVGISAKMLRDMVRHELIQSAGLERFTLLNGRWIYEQRYNE